MAKSTAKSRDAKPAKKTEVVATDSSTHAVRETVESIVIAFVLAFLFRTFEAEAFVIPTGSMAPTLMGRHKDVDCLKCSHRFRITASEEGDDAERLRATLRDRQANIHMVTNDPPQELRENPNQRQHVLFQLEQEVKDLQQKIKDLAIVAGVCPVCRYPMPMSFALPSPMAAPLDGAKLQRTFPGDRILVNKYLYTVTDPKRWDVIVFHFPGDAETNYIKRLVGLPSETLRVYQGDLYVGPPGAEAPDDFTIERKPADKVSAVRQLVHDTDFDPAELYSAGWPLRWKAESPTGGGGWKIDAQSEGKVVRQKFTVDRTGGGDAWMRYQHMVPNGDVWNQLAALRKATPEGGSVKLPDSLIARGRPELITDFISYNTRVTNKEALDGNNLWPSDAYKLGMHWVGDLIVEADVEITDRQGELVLDLVKAGKHFTCRIDLSSGQATLGIEGVSDYAPKANTPLTEPGEYRVAFANIDDQMLLWASKKSWRSEQFGLEPDLVTFDAATAYDAKSVFGDRALQPRTSAADRGDLAPAGIGARGSKLTVTRLQLWRDIYYIASSDERRRQEGGGPICDFVRPSEEFISRLRFDPATWPAYLNRKWVDFPLGADQFFVMGDNSPESSDARLWSEGARTGGRPGGAYLERKLLIGKAVCVYWPHSWFRIPYTKFGPVPNFKDMRLVR